MKKREKTVTELRKQAQAEARIVVGVRKQIRTERTPLEISVSKDTVRVFLTTDGVKREYTSFRGGPIEVYDFPKSYPKGLPRFVGYLSKETGNQLNHVLVRDHRSAVENAAYALFKARGYSPSRATILDFRTAFGGA